MNSSLAHSQNTHVKFHHRLVSDLLLSHSVFKPQFRGNMKDQRENELD